MASTDVPCKDGVLDAVDENNELHHVKFENRDVILPTEKCDGSPLKEDSSETKFMDEIENFVTKKPFYDNKSGDEHDNQDTESGTESDDFPVNLIDQKSSTLIHVTDLTVCSSDVAEELKTGSSFDLLRLGTSLGEPSETSIISKPPIVNAGESKVKKLLPLSLSRASSMMTTMTMPTTSTRKRSLLNELEAATNAELQEELALIRANHLPRRNWLDELVHWRDPVWSASVFGILLTVLVATTFYSLVSVVGYAGLLLLLGGTGLRIFSSASQRSVNLQRRSLVELSATFREENIRRILDLAASHVHPWALRLRRLLLVDSVADSVQFAGILYSLTYVGALIDGLTLLLMGVLMAFTLPLLYEKHKERIDAHAATFYTAWDRLVTEARSTAMSPLGKRD